jgi:hypothetical protein
MLIRGLSRLRTLQQPLLRWASTAQPASRTQVRVFFNPAHQTDDRKSVKYQVSLIKYMISKLMAVLSFSTLFHTVTGTVIQFFIARKSVVFISCTQTICIGLQMSIYLQCKEPQNARSGEPFTF